MQGNTIELHYYPIVPNNFDTNRNRHEVRLHESWWKNAYPIYGPVTRELLMIVLQNVQNIYIKASEYSFFEKAM